MSDLRFNGRPSLGQAPGSEFRVSGSLSRFRVPSSGFRIFGVGQAGSQGERLAPNSGSWLARTLAPPVNANLDSSRGRSLHRPDNSNLEICAGHLGTRIPHFSWRFPWKKSARLCKSRVKTGFLCRKMTEAFLREELAVWSRAPEIERRLPPRPAHEPERRTPMRLDGNAPSDEPALSPALPHSANVRPHRKSGVSRIEN